MAKRNAVVVTHTRLRQTGTVVAEAVSQLRVAGFEVAIIDNTEAPDFGVQPPCVSDDTEIVVVLGGDGTILRAAELVHCTKCDSRREHGACRLLGRIRKLPDRRGDPPGLHPRLFDRRTHDRPCGRLAARRHQAH